MRTTTIISDGIARIRMDDPPINALSVHNGFVRELTEAVRAALANGHVTALVLHGGGKVFCGGAEIEDFDDPQEVRRINILLDMIEQAAKPVVMAIHGAALGGGLELAMAGHYRLCTPETLLGLPEVTLGLLPGGGGTQRLPRLVGTEKALDLILSDEPIDGREAHAIGLVDRLATGDLVTAAMRWAGDLVGARPRRTGALPMPKDRDSIAAASAKPATRSTLSQALPFLVDCVEAAAPGALADGPATDARLFHHLLASDPAWGLQHAFFGERQVAHIPGSPTGLAQPAIERIAVVGAGPIGVAIATALLHADLPVTLIDPQIQTLMAGGKDVALTIDRDVETGRLDPDAAMARFSRLHFAASLDAAADADLVIAAVDEDSDVKRYLFRTLDRVARPGAILASTPAVPDLDAIADVTSRPDHVVGLNFAGPAPVTRLLEIVRGRRTGPDVLGAAMGLARRIGKVGVVAGVCDGFIGARLFEEYWRQAFFLLEEGALPADIDAALETWGMAMGPLRTLDLVGLDLGWNLRKRRALEQPERSYSRLPDLVCDLGRFGQKSGAGFYRYPDGGTPRHDPAIDELILWHAANLGIKRRRIADAEIIERCIFAMINEGAKLLAEGIAYRPVDIDMICLNGYGFPAARGGPMLYADQIGLPEVLRQLRCFAGGRHGWAWEPAPLLVDLVARGADLASLNDVGGVRVKWPSKLPDRFSPL